MSWVDIPKMERFLQNDKGIWWGFKVSGSSSNPPSEVSLTHTHTRRFYDESDNPLVWGVVSALVTGRALHLRVDEHFWKW